MILKFMGGEIYCNSPGTIKKYIEISTETTIE